MSLKISDGVDSLTFTDVNKNGHMEIVHSHADVYVLIHSHDAIEIVNYLIEKFNLKIEIPK